jgi:hypothetical protein
MSDLEELEKRKRELELRRDIARLERSERFSSKAAQVTDDVREVTSKISETVTRTGGKTSKWSWWWVFPLAMFGLFLVLIGLDGKVLFIAGLGVLFLVPAVAKFFKRG